MSTLRTWRERKGLSRQDVADAVGVADAMTVFRWEQDRGASNRRIPAEEYMRKLFRLSGGEVDPNSFYDLPDLDQPALPLGDEPCPLLERAA